MHNKRPTRAVILGAITGLLAVGAYIYMGEAQAQDYETNKAMFGSTCRPCDPGVERCDC